MPPQRAPWFLQTRSWGGGWLAVRLSVPLKLPHNSCCHTVFSHLFPTICAGPHYALQLRPAGWRSAGEGCHCLQANRAPRAVCRPPRAAWVLTRLLPCAVPMLHHDGCASTTALLRCPLPHPLLRRCTRSSARIAAASRPMQRRPCPWLSCSLVRPPQRRAIQQQRRRRGPAAPERRRQRQRGQWRDDTQLGSRPALFSHRPAARTWNKTQHPVLVAHFSARPAAQPRNVQKLNIPSWLHTSQLTTPQSGQEMGL